MWTSAQRYSGPCMGLGVVALRQQALNPSQCLRQHLVVIDNLSMRHCIGHAIAVEEKFAGFRTLQKPLRSVSFIHKHLQHACCIQCIAEEDLYIREMESTL